MHRHGIQYIEWYTKNYLFHLNERKPPHATRIIHEGVHLSRGDE
jgi:hypothetical protein